MLMAAEYKRTYNIILIYYRIFSIFFVENWPSNGIFEASSAFCEARAGPTNNRRMFGQCLAKSASVSTLIHLLIHSAISFSDFISFNRFNFIFFCSFCAMEFVPFLLFLFLFLLAIPPIRCDEIPLDGPDPEVDEHIRKQFQSHADAFSAGIKDGWAEEIQKQMGEEGNLADLIKPENVTQFIANWLPEHFRALLPKDLLLKLIKAMTSEGGAIAELYAGAERMESGDQVWRELKKKAPKTAELLEDAWAQIKKRWAKFNGMLNDEAKQYMEKVKDSGWHWFVRQVVGPFVRLPNDAKTNLTLSLFDAYPLMNTVMSKLMANRTFLDWAGEWYKNAEQQIQTMEKEKNATKEELNEDGIMAQMKEMFKQMNLGNLNDLMGGMGEEEEEEMREGEEQLEEEEEEEKEEEKAAEKEGEGEEEKEEGEEEEKEQEKEEGEGQCSKSNEGGGQCMAKEGEENAEKSETKMKEDRDEL